jgi:cytosine/adenosine deaminase-related metal-dependent hydrolase
MTDTTAGLVCAHHHLYSSLARGMPAPPRQPHDFISTLEQIWWRLDTALDLEMIKWSAALGAAEAVMCGTTAIFDHHESPGAIEGSLDAIAEGCEIVGVRVIPAYGITDRWSDRNELTRVSPNDPMTAAARRGLAECERYLASGRPAMVGLHASFTCADETLDAACDLAQRFDVGIHVHVAEGPDDRISSRRLRGRTNDKWLLVHCVELDQDLEGTIVHNPRSNMNNSVGYARPVRFENPVVLGTDGIGADMLEEFRLAYVAGRSDDISFSPDTAWSWVGNSSRLVPDVSNDYVRWNYDNIDSAWHVAFTPGTRAVDVSIAGKTIVANGDAVAFDLEEVRTKAAEQAVRLHKKLSA